MALKRADVVQTFCTQFSLAVTEVELMCGFPFHIALLTVYEHE